MRAHTPAILLAAADLLSKPGGWTQGALARNRKGEWVSESQKSAVCFCAMGALWRAARDEVGPTFSHFDVDPASEALEAVIGDHVADWNDELGRTADEVVTALRKAAAIARATLQDGGGE